MRPAEGRVAPIGRTCAPEPLLTELGKGPAGRQPFLPRERKGQGHHSGPRRPRAGQREVRAGAKGAPSRRRLGKEQEGREERTRRRPGT